MAAISQCPECDAQVSLPQGADPQSRVQCPLCGEEFPLQAALEVAPPELIVLDRPASATAPAVVDSADEIDIEAPAEQAIAFDFGTGVVDSEVAFDGDLVRQEEGETPRYSARRPRRGLLPVARQIVSVLLGGVLGLAIGYVVLLWVGGPPKDFLRLGERLPAILLPSSFHPTGDILDPEDSRP